MVLRIPDADNICYSPESDTKSSPGTHFIRFSVFFKPSCSRKRILHQPSGICSAVCIMKCIRFLPSLFHPAVQQQKRSVRPVIQIQDSIYSDQIFHQKITSFIRFVFLFCTMSFIILFLSEKTSIALERSFSYASDKQKYMCTNPTDGLEQLRLL